MKGLFQKDIALIASRNRSVLLFVVIGFMMAFSMDGAFVVGYLSILSVLLTVGTITYDEFDNGYPFLLTLPITRTTYVTEKYLFCLVGGGVGWLASLLIFAIAGIIQGHLITVSDLIDALAFLPFFGFALALLLPVQLKYGAEKSRLILAGAGGAVFVIIALAEKFSPEGEISIPALDAVNPVLLAILFAGLSVLALYVSWTFSYRFMSKREF